MKINIGCGDNIIDGPDIINIDSKSNSDKVKQGDLRNLNVLGIQDQSIDEILAVNAIQKIKIQDIGPTLKHWTDKLIKNGILYIESIDCKLLGQDMSDFANTPEVYNQLLYNNSEYVALYELLTIEAFLKQLGMETIQKGYRDLNFYLQMKKIS